MKFINSTQIRKAGNSAQFSMFMDESRVYMGEIFDFALSTLIATYNMFISGRSQWTKEAFVNKFVFVKLDEFVSIMGYLKASQGLDTNLGESVNCFKALIAYFNKDTKQMINTMITKSLTALENTFNAGIVKANRTMAKKRNGEKYVKTVEASKWLGMSIKERHDAEREVKAPFIFQFMKDHGMIDEQNVRTMSVKEIFRIFSESKEMIPTINMPAFGVTRSDVEFTVKAFDIGGRKAGRPKKTRIEEDSQDTESEKSVVPEVVVVAEETTPEAEDEEVSSPVDEEEEEVIAPVNKGYITKKDPFLNGVTPSVRVSSRVEKDDEITDFSGESWASKSNDSAMSLDDFIKANKLEEMERYEAEFAYQKYLEEVA